MSDDQLWEEEPEVKFRPSYSATTLSCPGSLRPSLKARDTAGREAAEGTLFHRLIAEWQLTNARPGYTYDHEFTIDGWTVKVDREMYRYAEECLARYDGLPGNRFVEVKVDISSLTPIDKQSGTADLVIVQPGILDIIDWKYGKGIQVFAKNNYQLLCYAWGAFQRFDKLYAFETIRLHIAQPRFQHYDMWEITREELHEFAVWARRQWARGWSGDDTRYPSAKACQWCRIRVSCPARQAQLERITNDTFEPVEPVEEIEVTATEQEWLVDPKIELSPPVELSTERLAWIYRYRRSIEVWFREIGEELLHRAAQGHDLGGRWKVVEGRLGNRYWNHEDVAAGALRRLGIPDDELWRRELISPAQAERLLADRGVPVRVGKEYLALYTDRSQGQPTLTAIEDDRPDLNDVVENTFNAEPADV